jgi:hypothetical protein
VTDEDLCPLCPPQELRNQARLADPGVAGQKDESSLPAFGPGELFFQQLQGFIPAYEGRRKRLGVVHPIAALPPQPRRSSCAEFPL